jgi:diacylglycerol kinase family enzyme
MEIIVNRLAHGGYGIRRWNAIADRVVHRLGSASVHYSECAEDAVSWIAWRLAAGERDFVAAGGDGTVRLLAQAILDHAGPGVIGDCRLGAIGLGSSNDFHKPFEKSLRIGAVACRIDFGAAEARDVGVLECEEAEGPRYWLLNASIGLTAEANTLFDRPDPILRRVKRFRTEGAIAYVALRALAANRPLSLRIESEAGGFDCAEVVNLGIVISPQFTGALRYDSPFDPRSGFFHVHLCRETRIAGKLRTLADLARGRFVGRGRTQSWRSMRLTVRADVPIPVEFDGEVITTSRVIFSLRKGLLRICR